MTVLPPKTVTTALPAPPEGSRQWYSGGGNDLNNTLARRVTLPAGEPPHADLPGQRYIRTATPPPATTATSRSTTAPAGRPSRAASPTRPRATASTVCPRATSPRRSTCRRTPARRSGCASATPPTAPPRAPTRSSPRACSWTTSSWWPAPRPCSPTAPSPAPTAGPRTASPRWPARPVRTTRSTTWPGTASYTSYDQYLKTGPYDFGYGTNQPDKVDHFPYQDGLEVAYRDASYSNNNVSEHPGNGQILSSTPTRSRSTGSTANPGGPACKSMTRRSAGRRSTRSRCTSTAPRLRPGPERAAAVRRHPLRFSPAHPAGRSQGGERRRDAEGARAGFDLDEGPAPAPAGPSRPAARSPRPARPADRSQRAASGGASTLRVRAPPFLFERGRGTTKRRHLVVEVTSCPFLAFWFTENPAARSNARRPPPEDLRAGLSVLGHQPGEQVGPAVAVVDPLVVQLLAP